MYLYFLLYVAIFFKLYSWITLENKQMFNPIDNHLSTPLTVSLTICLISCLMFLFVVSSLSRYACIVLYLHNMVHSKWLTTEVCFKQLGKNKYTFWHIKMIVLKCNCKPTCLIWIIFWILCFFETIMNQE